MNRLSPTAQRRLVNELRLCHVWHGFGVHRHRHAGRWKRCWGGPERGVSWKREDALASQLLNVM